MVSAVVALAALGGLALWALGRPGPSAGADLADVRATAAAAPTTSTAAPSAPVAAPSPSRSLPQPKTRDASLGSLTASAQPAPTRLVINALGVDARVDDVGVQDDGAMVIPAAPTSVGWYRYGAAPGDARGNTVIAGHVATREDGPGALAPLRGAKPGMRVTVTTADGTKHDYKVVGREADRQEGPARRRDLRPRRDARSWCSSPAAGSTCPSCAATATTSSSPQSRCRPADLRPWR